MEPDLRRVIIGSQRQEDRLAFVIAHVGMKPAIGEQNSAVVGLSSEIFGTGSVETEGTGHVRMYID